MNAQAELTSREYWDTWWARFSPELVSSTDPQYGRNGWFLRFMDRVCGAISGKTVVEIGGAMSLRLLSLAKFRNIEAIAVDYSAIGLQKTKELFTANGAKVDCIQADIFELVGTYDVVTHWGVLEHQINVGPLIAKCAKLTKGLTVFSMPNMLALGALGWKWYSPSNWQLHVVHSDAVIESECGRHGLDCRADYFGPPLFCMNPIENRRTATALLSRAQLWADRFGRILPYQYGLRRISQNRAFVCKKLLGYSAGSLQN
jgi:2-polyprenyl-3-methyl-5-hydroxy-6-metoxy-1,4-benzoquinol methylase